MPSIGPILGVQLLCGGETHAKINLWTKVAQPGRTTVGGRGDLGGGGGGGGGGFSIVISTYEQRKIH